MRFSLFNTFASRFSLENRNTTMMKMFLKLSFVFMLIIVVIISTCHTTQGSPIEQSSKETTNNHQETDEINRQVGEGPLDLKRISNGTTTTTTTATTSNHSSNDGSSNNRDEMDSVASANLLSILSDLDGAAELDLDGAHKQLLQPESSHLLSMNLLPGKRRFDDNTALASTGQARGNRFIMPNSQVVGEFKLPPVPPQLFNGNPSPMNTYATLNEALMDDPKLEQRASSKMLMSSQRRSGSGSVGNMPQADRRQLDIRPRAANKHSMVNGQAAYSSYNNHPAYRSNHQRQESIGRSTKPGGEPEQDSDQPAKDSDIFRDEPEERGGAEKRVAGANADQADYDDNDEADEADQGANARASSEASRMQQQQQQHQFAGKAAAYNPMQGIEDAAANGASGDQDEEIDATNLESKKSRPSVELTLPARGGQVGGYNQEEESSSKLEKENEQKLDSLGLEQDDGEASAASQLDKSAADLQTAAGHHHGHSHGHYYQYAGVPKKKAWKFGFKRGNHKHTISREEKGYKNKFHSNFKWHAKEKCKKHHKCESVGKMSWHYEHHDKKHHH